MLHFHNGKLLGLVLCIDDQWCVLLKYEDSSSWWRYFRDNKHDYFENEQAAVVAIERSGYHRVY